MQKKLKFLSAALAFFSLVAFSGRFRPVVDQERQLNEKINEIAEDAFAEANSYLPQLNGDGKFVIKKKLANQENEQESSSIDDSLYFLDVAKDLYSDLSSEEKAAFKNLSLEHSDDKNLSFFCDIFTEEDMTRDEFLNRDYPEEELQINEETEIKDTVFTITKKCLFSGAMELALEPWLLSTLEGGICSFIAGLSIPWWGWVIALAVLTALTIVFVVNWDKISPFWKTIITLFIDPFPAFAEAIFNVLDGIQTLAINASIDNSLDKTKKKVGNGGWTNDGLKGALNEALHWGISKTTAEEIAKNKGSDKPHVYLGRYVAPKDETDKVKSYTTFAIEYGGVYFSLPSYQDYSDQGFDMWVLNVFFLEFMISQDCDFRLCNQPSVYYNQATKTIVTGQEKVSYAKELAFINAEGFYWNTDVPIVQTYK